MSETKTKMPECKYDSTSGCGAIVGMKEGASREMCLLCIISQQQKLIKNACRIVIANPITEFMEDAMEITTFAIPNEDRFRKWMEEYRQDLIAETGKVPPGVKENALKDMMLMGPGGEILTREEAIARLRSIGGKIPIEPT